MYATAVSIILLIMPITLPYAEIMEINVQEEITCKRQNNNFLYNKYISQAIIQNITDTKSELRKTSRLTSFQTLTSPSRFCPFMPSFAFSVLLIPSLNVLSDYFLVC